MTPTAGEWLTQAKAASIVERARTKALKAFSKEAMYATAPSLLEPNAVFT